MTAHARLLTPKACIDQLDLDTSLACLPIFLTGCEHLLVLLGPTYTSRLWVRVCTRAAFAPAVVPCVVLNVS